VQWLSEVCAVIGRNRYGPPLMINYTDRIWRLMSDIVGRVPTLKFLDMDKVR